MYKLLFIPFLFFSSLFSDEPKPFVVGDLKGQLGNQMFEIATALSLAWDNDAVAYFPDLREKDKFNIQRNFEKVFFRINADTPPREVLSEYEEQDHTFQAIPFTPDMKIYGFYQSEKYFKHYREEIVELFQPVPEIMDYLHEKYAEIIDHPKTVAIHVRSYFAEDPNRSCFHLCSRQYFTNAMELFPDEDTLFVVFSDQMWWCKFAFRKFERQVIYIEDESYHHDFYLMSLCKNNIISNSSFSWWAAYLNQNPEKVVVAPAKWMRNKNLDDQDMVPEDWIKVDW